MSKNRTEQPNIASSKIDVLEKDEIFVFGSNLAGHHKGGAARAANMKFGAEWGVGVGLTGQAYAIPTMQGGVETIKHTTEKATVKCCYLNFNGGFCIPSSNV